MKYQKNYYYFKSALSSVLCDKIIKEGMSNNKKIAGIGSIDPRTKHEVEEVKTIRDSNISWISDVWLKILLEPYIQKANHMAGWNFDLVDSEDCQFTIYNQGQYYGWHTDTDGNLYYGKGNEWNNLMRKLSVTVSLSDPEDYEGGLLEFDLRNIGQINTSEIIKCKEILPRGSIVVFPSYTWHRVSPVTKGTRLSLVQWNLGPGFK
jgi:PKHD-type hydroxylase